MKLIYIESQNKYIDIESEFYPNDLYSDDDLDFFLRLEMEHKKTNTHSSFYELIDIYPTAKSAAKRSVLNKKKFYKEKLKDLDRYRDHFTNEVINKVDDFIDQQGLRDSLSNEIARQTEEIRKEIMVCEGQLSFLKKTIEKEKLEKIVKSEKAPPPKKQEAVEKLKVIQEKEKSKLNEKTIALAKEVPISTYINVRRDNKANCIFHSERTASMHINKQKNIYHCFGCGAHGSVVDIVMQQHQITFSEAVRKILNL